MPSSVSLRRLPPPARRRALELLADAGPAVVAEAIMLARGFSVEQMVELVRAVAGNRDS